LKTASLILFSLLFCGDARTQVSGRFTPGPLDQFLAVGTWSVELCNDGPGAVTLPPERVSMASGTLRLLRPAQALPLMQVRRAKNVRFVLMEIAEYAAMGAGVLGGSDVFSITKRGLGLLALGTGVAHQLSDKWRGEIPPLPPVLADDLFQSPITLAPAMCTTRSVYIMKMPRAQVLPVAFTIK
jgi:hypothetical protein